MKKKKPETREAAMHVRVRPSVKAAAERLSREDGRSLANWLERLIEAEEVTIMSMQDQPDDAARIANGLELMRAFRNIDSAADRRKVIDLAIVLATKEK
jgi:hypothetical protein